MTLRSLALTPRWIAFLFLALAVAAGFAALGQWQLSRAVASGTVVERATETVVPLESVARAQEPVTAKAAEQLVTVTGSLVPGTASVLSGRLNEGAEGYWVMAELKTDAGPSAAIALGWTASEKVATSIVLDPAERTVTGRFLSSEDASTDDFEHGQRKTASVPALVNEWSVAPDGVYSGYLVDDAAAPGLEPIYSPKPSTDVTLNLLNVFYAVEWVVFAGLAVYLWFRLLRDALERAEEEAADAEAERAAREPQLN